MNGRLPARLEALTPAWLTAALGQRTPGIVVRDLHVTGVVHGTTTKVRLGLDLNLAGRAAGVPEHVCVKINWEPHAEFTLLSAMYANEGRFYRFMREQLPLPAPAGYFGDYDDVTGQGIIVMEDLVEAQAAFGGNHRPLAIDEVAAGLEGLALLHATWWASPVLDGFPWLQTAMSPGTLDVQMHTLQVERYVQMNQRPERAAVLAPWILDDPDRVGRALEAVCAHEMALQGPRCLIHGDTHLGNSYRKPDGALCWLDWQLVRKGRPMREVSFFIGCALTVDDRRRHEQALLRHYLKCLRARGVEQPSFDAAWLEYRHWPIWGLLAWLGTEDGWQPREAILATLERFSTAIDDLETLSLLE